MIRADIHIHFIALYSYCMSAIVSFVYIFISHNLGTLEETSEEKVDA